MSGYIEGPWVSDTKVCEDEGGLAVIAVIPGVESTPTRGMVAWVNSGYGFCGTDGQAVATARLISAAPEMLEALILLEAEMVLSGNAESRDFGWKPAIEKTRAAIAKATGEKA